MLGLGRAIGETIAVTILIGDAPQLGGHLFGQGYSLAAVIANEFGEAQGLHRSALFAAGLVLFVLTLLVNGVARLLVLRAARAGRRRQEPDAGGPAKRRRGRGAAHERARRPAPAAAAARASTSARRAGARTGSPAAAILAATVLALIPLALIVYYLLHKGLCSWSVELLHDRPDRQHVLRELEHRRDQERDPRHDRDRRAGLGDRRPDRHRRRGVARRVRPRELVRATPCASSSTCSRACRRSCSGCSSTSC